MPVLSPFRIRLLLALPCVAVLSLALEPRPDGGNRRLLHVGLVWVLSHPKGIAVSWDNPDRTLRGGEYPREDYWQRSFLGSFCQVFSLAHPWGKHPAGTILGVVVSLTYWVVVPLSLVPLAAYHYLTRHQRRRARRIARGLCRECGYDLRAHQPHAQLSTPNVEPLPPRCPECGTPLPGALNEPMLR